MHPREEFAIDEHVGQLSYLAACEHDLTAFFSPQLALLRSSTGVGYSRNNSDRARHHASVKSICAIAGLTLSSLGVTAGFGASTRYLPDYSFRAHGEYLLELLDALHVPKAQLVGFSMGGGVVLSMADTAPQRVASIVMLSAIGLQEYELTGSYGVNHLVHGAQLSALWLLWNGFPHFGLFSKFRFTIEYARNFYDSDQRPLRAVLMHYRGPMLIIHGTKDRNVPIAAAREHHRLVPQSELIELDGNHFMAFTHPSAFVASLAGFLARTR